MIIVYIDIKIEIMRVLIHKTKEDKFKKKRLNYSFDQGLSGLGTKLRAAKAKAICKDTKPRLVGAEK